MRVLAAVFACSMILLTLLDAFETIILPRRVSGPYRLTRLFYILTWRPWKAVVIRIRNRKRREDFLGFFGPLSLLMLFGVWASQIILGFAILQWSSGSALISANGKNINFAADLYMSGTTFFTLGLGDLTPRSTVARLVTVLEGGTGFAFLGIVIGYLPVLYQAFSRREVNISLLDARAGSPPTCAELLRRHAHSGGVDVLPQFLTEWERWAAELLESHISYPVLCYFRSQHENQSWVAALTTVLDTCALVIVGIEGTPVWQAQLTFAMARHAMVDINQIFGSKPLEGAENRLPPEDLASLRSALMADGLRLNQTPETDQRLTRLRAMYEPYVAALSNHLAIDVPTWIHKPGTIETDNWRTSAWKVDH